jgi:S1-C subfamily serine protease
MKRIGSLVILGVGSFFGGVVGSSLLQHHPVIQAETAKPAPPPPVSLSGDRGVLGDRFEGIIKQVAPTVVAIEAIKPPTTNKDGSKSAKPVEESGSGVLVKWEGVRGTIVITNNHVITGASAEKITVHLADNRLFHPSKVLTDPESDIALLHLDVENLPTCTLGDSDRARIGQWVLAFGSPFGLNQSVTHGIISARDRGQVSLGSTIRIKDFLQTDAAINPGSSGGPLVNLDGEIVGINTAIASYSNSNSGVAFSIPINLVKRIGRQLVDKGSVTRGYLGVQLAAVMEPSDALRLGLDKAEGAWVEGVYPETPAAKVGLKQNDVVLQVDGIRIRNENHLINLISTLPVGQKVQLRIWRDRAAKNVEILVGDWSQERAKLRTE